VAQPSRDDFCGQTGPPGRAGQLPHATPAPPPRRTAPRPGGSNAQIATSAVGLISITTGGNLIWSLVAIVVGILIGTLFMATHSTQGPQLGLPQMIQSRPQFGYIGALLVWLFAYAQYAGFNVFNTILAGEAVATTGHVGSAKVWFWIVTIGEPDHRCDIFPADIVSPASASARRRSLAFHTPRCAATIRRFHRIPITSTAARRP